MKYIWTLLLASLSCSVISAQLSSVRGNLSDADGNPVEFANIVLYAAADTSLVKVETTDETGDFLIPGIKGGDYLLEATYVGLQDLRQSVTLVEGRELNLERLVMQPVSVQLEEAVVTADRAMVEIKPDRTVFNVQGTINSTGDDALNLLRKAPGVLVDNNDNITVLSRSGVRMYVDGKRLPLSGEDLANYLRNIPAEQIDAIDIITNPGAKYEAEGTAGIIDIKLKRDKSLGSNGSLSTTYGQGRYASGNVSGSLNYRNKVLSAFGQAGYGDRQTFTKMAFQSKQNGFATEETIRMDNENSNYNYRLGTDFFIKENHTIGFLVSGNNGERFGDGLNRVEIATQGGTGIDSILLGNNITDAENNAATYNLNYVFNNKKTTLNVDLDYGRYRNNSTSMQPNRYLDPGEESVLSEVNTSYDTRNDIDIYTFLVDFETDLWGGKLGLGTKLSQVGTDNTFLFYDIPSEDRVFNEQRSNIFEYDENVYAGYVNFARGFGEKINVSAGLRLEQTDARGVLQAFDPSLNEPPVESNYLSAFPSGGITYQMGQNTLAL
ncbi:MAG: TonB-dependent receptor, partial [Saprospiraceae bacterium]|nr:TonB-dependent receptor [Saprospiraceae bacterium]